jgi:hypothetical protein
MRKKIFLLKTLLFCFLFVSFFSFVNADFQTLQNLKIERERIKTIKESVDYLIRFSEEERNDQDITETLKDIKIVTKSIEQEVEEKIESETREIVECLSREELVIYGFKGCAGCDELMDQFGDYDFLDLIYVECSDEVGRCLSEMKDPYVPEIQIKQEAYQGVNTIYFLGKATGCIF